MCLSRSTRGGVAEGLEDPDLRQGRAGLGDAGRAGAGVACFTGPCFPQLLPGLDSHRDSASHSELGARRGKLAFAQNEANNSGSLSYAPEYGIPIAPLVSSSNSGSLGS